MMVSFSTDQNYVGLTAVAMTSLLLLNPGAHVVILCNQVSEESNLFLKNLCERLGGRYESIDVAPYLRKLIDRKANGYTSFSCYARLFLPDFFPRDRVIYLDSDTIVCGSLSPLMSFDMRGRSCALALDCQRVEYRKMIGMAGDSAYYNTGVMIIDCDKWCQRNCTGRILSLLDRDIPRSIFPDQDMVNLSIQDEIAQLPPEFNFLPHYQMFRTRRDCLRVMGIPQAAWYTEAEYQEARRNPVVRHFLGNTLGRPWTIQSLNPIRSEYKRIAALAGVPEVAEQSRPLDKGYRVQAWMWRYLPNPIFVESCRAMYRLFFWSRYGM